MSTLRILITGASGYIGGSILTGVLQSSNLILRHAHFTILVRRQEQLDVINSQHSDERITPVLFNGLDDVDFLREIASKHDIVINTADAKHPASARALIQGLAERQRSGVHNVCFIHQSGTSSIADRPISGVYRETRIFNDETDDIYAYMKAREAEERYIQRTCDLTVIETGIACNVRTFILMSPTIYGEGSGWFNRHSMQIPGIMKASLQTGYTVIIGSGEAEWDHVHVEDLVQLHLLLLLRLVDAKDGRSHTSNAELPSGARGIYFTGTGHQSWLEVSQRVAKEGHSLGYLPTDEVKSVILLEGAQILAPNVPLPPPGGPPPRAELGYASRSRTEAVLAKTALAWKPSKTRQDFENTFKEEWEAVWSGEQRENL